MKTVRAPRFENVSLKVHAGDCRPVSRPGEAGGPERKRLRDDSYHSGRFFWKAKVKKNSPKRRPEPESACRGPKVQGLALKKNIRENMVVSDNNSLFKTALWTRKGGTICNRYGGAADCNAHCGKAGWLLRHPAGVVIAKWLMYFDIPGYRRGARARFS